MELKDPWSANIKSLILSLLNSSWKSQIHRLGWHEMDRQTSALISTYCWGRRSHTALSWPLRWVGRWPCGRVGMTWWRPWRRLWRSVSSSARWALGGRWWRRLWACRASRGPQTHSDSWRWSVWSSGCTAGGGENEDVSTKKHELTADLILTYVIRGGWERGGKRRRKGFTVTEYRGTQMFPS